MQCLTRHFLLLLMVTAGAFAAGDDSSSDDPLPRLHFFVENSWVPPHLKCAAIISGTFFTPHLGLPLGSLPFVPYGALSTTVNDFHPLKQGGSNPDVSRRELGEGRVLLRGLFRDAILERTFKKNERGLAPHTWGTFHTSYAEYDPVFAKVRVEYEMKAADLVITAESHRRVKEVERRLSHQIGHTIGPIKLKQIAEILAKNRKASGNVRITKHTANSATAIDPDDDMGSVFFIEPDVSLAPHFCFHHSPEQILQVKYEIIPDALIVRLVANDNKGFSQKIEFTFAQSRSKRLIPQSAIMEVSTQGISAKLGIHLDNSYTAEDYAQRMRGFHQHFQILSAQYSERFVARAQELSDGVIRLRGVKSRDGGEELRGSAIVFYANQQDPVDGRVKFKLSPALTLPHLGDYHLPGIIHYHGRHYSVQTEENQAILIDLEDGKRYEGSYHFKPEADYEVGNIPMAYYSIRGLPGN